MAKLQWDLTGERYFETGVDHGVLYVSENGTYPSGVAWNGLTQVSESPSGAEANPQYADNIKYLNLVSVEELGGTIEAFTYPDEFGVCDGSIDIAPGFKIGQQRRKSFGFSYRTRVGNDVEGDELGYKLHLIYNALATPSEKAYATVNESPEAITFSWEFTTTAVPVTGHRPTSQLTFDSRNFDATALKALEDVLYGTEADPARLPLPDEVIALVGAAGVVTDNGDSD